MTFVENIFYFLSNWFIFPNGPYYPIFPYLFYATRRLKPSFELERVVTNAGTTCGPTFLLLRVYV